jgi:hypothetical protein
MENIHNGKHYTVNDSFVVGKIFTLGILIYKSSKIPSWRLPAPYQEELCKTHENCLCGSLGIEQGGCESPMEPKMHESCFESAEPHLITNLWLMDLALDQEMTCPRRVCLSHSLAFNVLSKLFDKSSLTLMHWHPGLQLQISTVD